MPPSKIIALVFTNLMPGRRSVSISASVFTNVQLNAVSRTSRVGRGNLVLRHSVPLMSNVQKLKYYITSPKLRFVYTAKKIIHKIINIGFAV